MAVNGEDTTSSDASNSQDIGTHQRQWFGEQTDKIQFANAVAMHVSSDRSEFILSLGLMVPTMGKPDEQHPPIHTITRVAFTTNRLQDLYDLIEEHCDHSKPNDEDNAEGEDS